MEDGLCCKVGSKAVIHKIPSTEKSSSSFTHATIEPKLENGNDHTTTEHIKNVKTDSISIIPFCI